MRGRDKPMARFYGLPIYKRYTRYTPTNNLAMRMSKALKQLTNTAPTTVKAATDFFVKYKI